MADMLFLCNGTVLFQGNLPRVGPVTIFKYASCLIPYILSFNVNKQLMMVIQNSCEVNREPARISSSVL